MFEEPDITLAGILPFIQTGTANTYHATDDAYWMRMALLTAMMASGQSNPNPAVGAVLVKDGRCIAAGATEQVGGRHAERVALDAAGPLASKDATLFVTLEPCAHHGRQPPCADAIVAAGIKRCVIGSADTDQRVCGKGIRRLRDAGIVVRQGVLAQETSAWHLPFLSTAASAQIFVAAKWAQTLDGQLAYDNLQPQAISGPEAQTYAHWLRQRYDAILVGAGTVLVDHPRLTVRRGPWARHRQPVRVVLDPHNRLSRSDQWPQLQATTFGSDAPVVYLHGPGAGRLILGCHVATCVIEPDKDLPSQILARLAEPALAQKIGRPVHSLLVEGGPRLHALFFEAGLVDAAHLFIAPIVSDGNRHRVTLQNKRCRLNPVGSWPLGKDVLVEMLSDRTSAFLAQVSQTQDGQIGDILQISPIPDIRTYKERRYDWTYYSDQRHCCQRRLYFDRRL